MNDLIQNILAFTTLGIALLFLVRKFIWNPKSATSKKACGDTDCGCH
ncbi:FeoB-associated Cys-rich membrane protein [Mangrovimonas cancribranchiae]|uniref:FeoB-associated Cys-rich membrane protein n=1 Tax=Mangrovimonas cancribranchiae TaxID=3080055 RepID=A0AAU6P656_9FLAO